MIRRIPGWTGWSIPFQMRVDQTFGVLVVRSALVRMAERSLGERQQQAGDQANVYSVGHVLLCYLTALAAQASCREPATLIVTLT